jgi:hypothetical protein
MANANRHFHCHGDIFVQSSPRLTISLAVANARETKFLAHQIKYVDRVVESQKFIERERALQHLARELRVL